MATKVKSCKYGRKKTARKGCKAKPGPKTKSKSKRRPKSKRKSTRKSTRKPKRKSTRKSTRKSSRKVNKNRMDPNYTPKRLGSSRSPSRSSTFKATALRGAAKQLSNARRENQALREQIRRLQQSCELVSRPQPIVPTSLRLELTDSLVTVPQYMRWRMNLVNQPHLFPNDAKDFSRIGRIVASLYRDHHDGDNPQKIPDEGTMIMSRSSGLRESRFLANAYKNPEELWIIEDGLMIYQTQNPEIKINPLPQNMINKNNRFKRQHELKVIEDNAPIASLHNLSRDFLEQQELRRVERQIQKEETAAKLRERRREREREREMRERERERERELKTSPLFTPDEEKLMREIDAMSDLSDIDLSDMSDLSDI